MLDGGELRLETVEFGGERGVLGLCVAEFGVGAGWEGAGGFE